MSPFLELPPELRTPVYDFLLDSSLTNKTHILYISDRPIHSRGNSSLVRHKTYNVHQDSIALIGDEVLQSVRIIDAIYKVHLADMDDLLSLASTYRLLRSDILALAWSNAYISVKSFSYTLDLRYFLYDRLSSDVCAFIRTLQVEVEQYRWSRPDMSAVAELIRCRLPQLQKLTVDMPVRSPPDRAYRPDFPLSLLVFKGLSKQVTVKFIYHDVLNDHREYQHRKPEQLREWSEQAGAALQTLRAGVETIRKRQRDEQARRQQMADVLEATVALRSLSMT